MNISLPDVTKFNANLSDFGDNSIVILSEGFEDRSLHWISSLPKDIQFKKIYICKYDPEKKSRLNELLPLVRMHSINEPTVVTFYRFEPQKFEMEMRRISDNLRMEASEEIVIDISVMSKLLIMIILCSLQRFEGKVRIIYTEPMDYSPSQEDYLAAKNNINHLHNLPSLGVHDVVRTSLLSSTIMQRRPNAVICFTSFNEQLLRAMLSVINPTHLLLINGVPPHLHWREIAMQEICKGIICDFKDDNDVDTSGSLVRKTSTLNYKETFKEISEIYKRYCYSYRIILAPTGSKMQTVGCAIVKICCPDIHMEYPTPESFYFHGYSSKEIRDVHQVEFPNFSSLIRNICEIEGLNG